MIKAAFFDIDGTLLSFKTHRIPASAQRVLDSFHEQGIACVIATGRPTYQMPDWLFDLGWDAYITLSGQHCFDSEGVYRSCPIDPDDVAVIVDQVAQGRYDSLCMQGENSFVNRLSERVVTAGSNAGIVYHEEPFEHAFDAPVYQFCAFVDPADEHIVTDAVAHSLTTRWSDLFCDIIPANGGKDLGVAATLERLGIDASEAIAFGDGENDLSMFAAVGTSVAMGNAQDTVKAAATYVTTAVDDDGIYNAAKHFGLV
jgi:Cof subfamily protein (haloacid dehalogenase superfamily)